MKSAFQYSDTQAKLSFDKDNGAVDVAIAQLLELAGEVHHSDIIRHVILTAIKAGSENGGRGDLKQMNTVLKDLRYTSKIFKPYRHVRKVSVFG
jgi:hypothetical protein